MLCCGDQPSGAVETAAAEDDRWPLRTGARSDETGPLTPAQVRQTTSIWTLAKFAFTWVLGIALTPLVLPFALVWFVLAPFFLTTNNASLVKEEEQMRARYPLTGGVSEAYWGSLVASITKPIIGLKLPQNAYSTWLQVCFLPLLFSVVVVPLAAAINSPDLFTYAARSAAAAQFSRGSLGSGTLPSWRQALLFPAMIAIYAGALVDAYSHMFNMFRTGSGLGDEVKYWFHINALWTGGHDEVDAILRSGQVRGPTRGGMLLIAPDMFAPRILIFLSNPANGRESEWAAIRAQAHKLLFVPSGARVKELERRVRADWASTGSTPPSVADLRNSAHTVRLTTKTVFFTLFGVWLDDADALVLKGWQTLGGVFTLPRATQRLAYNAVVRQVGALRINSLGIMRKHKLEGLFAQFNEGLGNWKRAQLAEMADEIMFLVGFAGIGGTSSATASVGRFLGVQQSIEGGKDGVDFGGKSAADMRALYTANPQAFIMETCRLSTPVGDITTLLREATSFPALGLVPKGTPVAAVLNMANRDPAVFPKPNVFDPSRAELSKALTWNGQAFGPNEASYPRICPGRNLAIELIKVTVGVALSSDKLAHAP